MTVARATKLVAKTGLVAPFVDVEVAVLVGVEDMGIDTSVMDIVMDMPVADAPDAVEGEPVNVPPMGVPLISAWTDALNVPRPNFSKNISADRYERACGHT